MASNIPAQARVVDPFASYNSNVVNQLTRGITHGDDGLLTINSLYVTQTASNKVTVSTGYIIIQDVLIKIDAPHIVDFTDPQHYYSPAMILPQVGGYHYVVLDYIYQKSKPAPQASIKILKPSQRSLITLQTNLFLLKVIELDSSSPHDIINVFDYDPEDTNKQRKYVRYYAGGSVILPPHNTSRDEGRVVYESDRQRFYFGYSDHWGELTAGGVSLDLNTDTTGVEVGMLCYVDSNRDAVPAIGTSLTTSADVVVTSIGSLASAQGRAVISGFVTGVPVETGRIVSTGDILYLSAIDAGRVTNVRPDNIYQIVGRALSNGSPTVPIDMIFSPKIMLASSITGTTDTWDFDISTSWFYHDINVDVLDGTTAFDCHWWDVSTNTEISPALVEIRNNGTIIRVYMSTNLVDLNYIIQSPASYGAVGGGGGGGGMLTDHALLSNLDYANSGHTGFSPSNHDNTFHSQTYITSSSVNFTTLNANSAVGSGASQVAQGNHTHPEYVDIPSGSIILFESDVAITGYTLLTTETDMVVYITRGSAAGGDTGATLKTGGTWTQPSHNHNIPTNAAHTHTTAGHTLTVSEIPSHNHMIQKSTATQDEMYGSGQAGTNTGTQIYSGYTGGGSSHAHGNTGSSGAHDHGGQTGNANTLNTWRPRGLNYTRQQRI